MTSDPGDALRAAFGAGGREYLAAAPGRVNLIGEHIDYHGLPALPMALRRRVRVACRPRTDARIRAVSEGYGRREFDWTAELGPAAPGDWENYLRAAAVAVARKWGAGAGMDAAVLSDLPPAAGLSSSSALLVAFTLALLRANGWRASFEELMEILPEGEQFVGTRGGGMDHAVCLAGREGCALLVNFSPLAVRPAPIPREWGFLAAHSGRPAEKSGAARTAYNARRAAGAAALKRLGRASWGELRAGRRGPEEIAITASEEARLAGEERAAFRHVTGEWARVEAALEALERADAARFGGLMLASHASLRDLLKVSCPELDRLVEAAMASGALGARLTGAGFGGCAVIFAFQGDLPKVREGLLERFYGRAPAAAILEAEPGPGALFLEIP